MDRSYNLTHRIEETHWWFNSRRDMILRLLDGVDKRSRILDIGCSGGPLIKLLREKGFRNVSGIDVNENAIKMCRRRGIGGVTVMDATRPKLGSGKFDMIIASDVLEHIKDDGSALAKWNKILKTGGKLVIFVPAINFLWTKHDEIHDHCRRYTKSGLTSRLERANFRVERSSYWNFALFFPTAMMRVLQRVLLEHFPSGRNRKNDPLYELNASINGLAPINWFLMRLMKLENTLVANNRLDFPIGISVFAVAAKKALP